MKPKTLFHLLMFTFLIGAALLNTREALCQVRTTVPAHPVGPPVPLPQPSAPVIFVPPPPMNPSIQPVPQTPVTAAPQATQSTRASAASGSPPPDTATSIPDAGAETPTPTPEITPTAASSGSWRLWLIAVVGVVLVISWASRRRGGRN